jgi:hypothetical protein
LSDLDASLEQARTDGKVVAVGAPISDPLPR